MWAGRPRHPGGRPLGFQARFETNGSVRIRTPELRTYRTFGSCGGITLPVEHNGDWSVPSAGVVVLTVFEEPKADRSAPGRRIHDARFDVREDDGQVWLASQSPSCAEIFRED